MKKFVVAGLLAISAMVLVQQQASAWVNSRFGIGLNWELQSGGNQLLWGLWRNGQPPGPEAFGQGGYHGGGYHGGGYHGGGYHGAPRFGPYGPGFMPHGYAPPMPQAYPQGYGPMPQAYPQGMNVTAEPPMSAMPVYYSSPYQFANYPRPVYYYYYPYYGQ